MSYLDDPLDPPAGTWQAEHLERYVRTGGEDGHLWNGVPTLLLTTSDNGIKRARRTALIYGRDADTYLVVASAGGRPEHPVWYRNLSDEPEVRIQVIQDTFTARARTETDEDERARLWSVMTSIWPAYDEYQTKTDRTIPLVVLERS